MKPLRVSVIVPAYNADRFLADTLAALLRQQRPVDEIVVVDDGSDDATTEVARRFFPEGVRLLERPHAGDAAALNAGATATTSDVVGVCDSDDVWLDNLLADLLPAFDDSLVGFAYGGTQNVRDAPELREGQRLGQMRVGPVRGNTLVRRAALDEVGPWDETLRSQSGLDWWSRAIETSWRAQAVDRLTMLRRVHDRNLNFTLGADRDREMPVALRAHLARRRQAAK